MSESVGIDSISGGTMPKPYSGDLRARVIEEVATGASRREAAERYGISASVVVIWAQRWEKTGSVAAKPSAPCRPFDKELPTAVAFTDEGKAEKVEGLRFSEPAMSASLWRQHLTEAPGAAGPMTR